MPLCLLRLSRRQPPRSESSLTGANTLHRSSWSRCAQKPMSIGNRYPHSAPLKEPILHGCWLDINETIVDSFGQPPSKTALATKCIGSGLLVRSDGFHARCPYPPTSSDVELGALAAETWTWFRASILKKSVLAAPK